MCLKASLRPLRGTAPPSAPPAEAPQVRATTLMDTPLHLIRPAQQVSMRAGVEPQRTESTSSRMPLQVMPTITATLSLTQRCCPQSAEQAA